MKSWVGTKFDNTNKHTKTYEHINKDANKSKETYARWHKASIKEAKHVIT